MKLRAVDCLLCAVAVLFLCVTVEVCSIAPFYVSEKATVRKVVKNPKWKFIGADEMTLVRFIDGFDTEVAGNRGEPGDVILVGRQRGTQSLFGVLGDRRARKEAGL